MIMAIFVFAPIVPPGQGSLQASGQVLDNTILFGLSTPVALALIVWIVAIMNMVNFLDGLDGLAAGVCGIAGATFAVIALSLAKPNAAAFSAIVLGATLGFLRHNFFPARVFMGDSGAMLLGFVLAAIPLQGLLKTASIVTLFFPLLVLAIPIIDTGFVVVVAPLADRIQEPTLIGEVTLNIRSMFRKRIGRPRSEIRSAGLAAIAPSAKHTTWKRVTD